MYEETKSNFLLHYTPCATERSVFLWTISEIDSNFLNYTDSVLVKYPAVVKYPILFGKISLNTNTNTLILYATIVFSSIYKNDRITIFLKDVSHCLYSKFVVNLKHLLSLMIFVYYLLFVCYYYYYLTNYIFLFIAKLLFTFCFSTLPSVYTTFDLKVLMEIRQIIPGYQ